MNMDKLRLWVALAPILLLSPSVASEDPGLVAFRAGDYAQARSIWHTDSVMGDPQSQFRLGYLYESGKGVDVDHGTAAFWYEQSADAGCRAADCNLANLHMRGKIVGANPADAIHHFARCVSPGGTCKEQIAQMRELAEASLTRYAEQNYAEAQYQLARQEQENGAFESAAAWLQKAAQQQHGPAQIALSSCYLYGEGVSPDPEQGARLVFSAMLQHRNDADVLHDAKSMLAIAYNNGQIETRNRPLAEYVWALMALEDVESADSMMGKMYDMIVRDVKGTLTESDLNEAQRVASRWSELFAAGLPGVTVEHLRTLDAPP